MFKAEFSFSRSFKCPCNDISNSSTFQGIYNHLQIILILNAEFCISENVDMDGSDSSQPLKVEIPNKNAEILRICFGLVIVGVLSISISVFSLLGRNGHDHAH